VEIDRRTFLKLSGATAFAAGFPGCARSPENSQAAHQAISADYTLRIATGLIEVAPNRVIATTLYNNQFPGPLIRLREGRAVTIDVYNDTEIAEQLHWHGQLVPVEIDGAAEEGTPSIPARSHRRLVFTPGPAGLRWYHSHSFAGADLRVGLYGGQVGMVYIEPAHDPGAYDQEVFLVLKEFSPSLTHLDDDMDMGFLIPSEIDPRLKAAADSSEAAARAKGLPHGFGVAYGDPTINGKGLGYGEPIRVKVNDRVLVHLVNASATEIRSVALPGHTFHVLALDGNPVPIPADVPVLWIAPGERVSAVVRMAQPGVWIMGETGEDRYRGMGIVVEYAGATGSAKWIDPPSTSWDYRRFGDRTKAPSVPDARIDMVISEENAALNGFNRWLINGTAFSMADMTPRFPLVRGRRYRLRMRNASDDIHPIHLHRHVFELTSIAGQPAGGVLKDVVMLGAYQEMEIDFTANSPGLSLFHCHMQLHMDYGFMALFDCR
jgi:FtsP/CotA-like multicopper oxidase with cupredoxin domain